MVRSLLRALRPAQWVKNLFVLGPLLFARRLQDRHAVLLALVAFAAWCAVASAVYLGNDLADLEADRAHPDKKDRPLASGALPVWVAVTAAALLGASGLAIALRVSPPVAALLAGYVVANALYSLWLKQVVLVDVMVVASGFVLRVLAGAWVIRVPPSPWILVVTGLLALFLGFAKRRQELATAGDAPASRAVLEHYTVGFLDGIQTMLAAATVIAYALYCVSPATVGRVGDLRMLLTAPVVLHGILRYLYLVEVRGHGENPTRVALTDPGIILTVVVWVGLSAILLYV